MSQYTTELRFICESLAGHENTEYSSVNSVIQTAIPFIFDFDFPIFDESYRNILETKIIKHYYTREIGLETYGLWKLKLDTKLNEIMPYYNQLYESATLDFNPLWDTNYIRQNKRDNNQNTGTETSGTTEYTDNTTSTTENTSNITDNSETSQNVDNNHWDYYSDTPQGGVDGLQDRNYLTNARNTTDNNTIATTDNRTSNTTTNGTTNSGTSGNTANSQSSNSTITSTDQFIEQIQGKTGGSSYASMINEYRSTLLNIDMQVIDELSDLFMLVY